MQCVWAFPSQPTGNLYSLFVVTQTQGTAGPPNMSIWDLKSGKLLHSLIQKRPQSWWVMSSVPHHSLLNNWLWWLFNVSGILSGMQMNPSVQDWSTMRSIFMRIQTLVSFLFLYLLSTCWLWHNFSHMSYFYVTMLSSILFGRNLEQTSAVAEIVRFQNGRQMFWAGKSGCIHCRGQGKSTSHPPLFIYFHVPSVKVEDGPLCF